MRELYYTVRKMFFVSWDYVKTCTIDKRYQAYCDGLLTISILWMLGVIIFIFGFFAVNWLSMILGIFLFVIMKTLGKAGFCSMIDEIKLDNTRQVVNEIEPKYIFAIKTISEAVQQKDLEEMTEKEITEALNHFSSYLHKERLFGDLRDFKQQK